MRFPHVLAAVGLWLACALGPASAEGRIALVIGNEHYVNLPAHEQLHKAVNNARAVGNALKQIGFEVVPGEDLGRQALIDRLDKFARRLSPGDIVFFFFSGHGVALDGANYILPADVPDIAAGQETNLKAEALGEQYITSELMGRGVQVAVVVLDASRANPFTRPGGKSVGLDKGLAPPPHVLGAVSIYAAASGEAALDRLNDDDHNPNSVFTRVLASELTTPRLDLEKLGTKVRDEVARVARTAGHTQRPEYYDGMNGGRAMPLTAAQEGALKAKDRFRECVQCPEMVVLPAGSFTMGSPAGESNRTDDEGPQHDVTIGKFAVGKFHVTLGEFATFVGETGYQASSHCRQLGSVGSIGSWHNPGIRQERSHPVVCVSWDDAKAYAAWLEKKTGKPYRLLSESEWEYAARGKTSPGVHTRYWFGDDEGGLCSYANSFASCDRYEKTSPAGRFPANAFGLHDMAGNAWQWTEDCWHDSYDGAPADGTAWTTACSGSAHVVRGGSWADGRRDLDSPGWRSVDRTLTSLIPAARGLSDLRAADRGRYSYPDINVGFRVARTLAP